MTTPDQLPSIEPADLASMPDVVVLDVREPDEWAAVVTPEGTAGHVI